MHQSMRYVAPIRAAARTHADDNDRSHHLYVRALLCSFVDTAQSCGGFYTPRLPLISGREKPNVIPARNSSTGWPLTTAWRKPTSKLRLSLTCQIAPTRPDTVRDCPISSS